MKNSSSRVTPATRTSERSHTLMESHRSDAKESNFTTSATQETEGNL